MKKPALIASITAGVILLGGGAWAATTLPASSDGTASAVETVEPSVTPEATETPTPTPTAEATPTPTPEPSPTAEFDEIRDIYLPWARENYDDYASQTPTLPAMTDADLIAALETTCSALVGGDVPPDVSAIPGFETAADLNPSTWEDEANRLFTSAAELGYGPNITGEPGSYCD